MMAMDNNRKTAFEVLMDVEKHQAYSNLALNNFIVTNKCDNPAFVREIVYGVIKNKYLLDYICSLFIKKGFNRLKAGDLSLLRMGTYQLLFMDSVPEYAAVSETVELAKVFVRGKERFINGVLRNIARNEMDIALPFKDEDPFKYLSVRYSAEPWIVDLLVDSFGFKEAENYLRASNETPDLSVRVNTLMISRDELIDELGKLGIEAIPSKHSERGLLLKGTGILGTELFAKGYFSVQDEASIIAIDMLDPKPGDTVADLCAAPGGKTASIAEHMNNDGKIFAFDVYANKINLVSEVCGRNGISIVKTSVNDATELNEMLIDRCDKVLCDVPCSGIGVIRRKPEIKYKDEVDIELLIKKQTKILHNASMYVKPGGVLMYSTCTVNPQENQKQIEKFLNNHAEYNKIEEKNLLPQKGTDGFYICLMRRL